jgi:CRISPR-associated endonuclease Csy4
MDHYLEIWLLPDPEFKATVLMNALFAKLHRALFDLDNRRVGVSFPAAEPERPGLGDRLRLHGEAEDLQNLMELQWLTGMRDHTALRGPVMIPDKVSYRIVRRVQVKSSPERLRRRLAKRKGLTDEEAKRAIPLGAAERLNLPYVTIKSRSTGQDFRLFVDQMPPMDHAIFGSFNHYGLSATATVPWF